MTITGGNQATEVAFKNCVPFLSVSQKIYETTIDDAEDLDFVVPI